MMEKNGSSSSSSSSRKKGDNKEVVPELERSKEYTLIYDKAIHSNPNNAYLYLLRAIQHCFEKNFIESVADANKAIQLDPTLREAYTRKGIALLSLNRLQDARTAFLEAATCDPNRPGETRAWLGKLDHFEQLELANTNQYAGTTTAAADGPDLMMKNMSGTEGKSSTCKVQLDHKTVEPDHKMLTIVSGTESDSTCKAQLDHKTLEPEHKMLNNMSGAGGDDSTCKAHLDHETVNPEHKMLTMSGTEGDSTCKAQFDHKTVNPEHRIVAREEITTPVRTAPAATGDLGISATVDAAAIPSTVGRPEEEEAGENLSDGTCEAKTVLEMDIEPDPIIRMREDTKRLVAELELSHLSIEVVIPVAAVCQENLERPEEDLRGGIIITSKPKLEEGESNGKSDLNILGSKDADHLVTETGSSHVGIEEITMPATITPPPHHLQRLKDFLDEDSGVGITHEAGSEAENIKMSQVNVLTTREDATNPLAATEAAVSQLDTGATISAPVTPSHLLISEEILDGIKTGDQDQAKLVAEEAQEQDEEDEEEEEDYADEEEEEQEDEDEDENNEDSGSDGPHFSGLEDDSSNEGPLTDEDVQQLVDELLQVESEAAEAQEALEDESLEATEQEVQQELAETLSGSELEAAVEKEMSILKEQWQEKVDELEDKSALLQEKLDDAGVSLPDLFKWIEKQAPEGCTTEAWKKRTHWAGLQATQEAFEVVSQAEQQLTNQRPVRRHHGRLQDEGASGFLDRKVKSALGPTAGPISDDGWSMVGFLDKEDEARPGHLMGTEKWAAVYLASTPEQAALMGLDLPGINTVEEIGDIEVENSKLFTEALENERERGLTDRQKTSLKKVREEDDAKKLHKQQRRASTLKSRSRCKRAAVLQTANGVAQVKKGACRNEEGNKVDSVEQEAEVTVKMEPMVTVEAEVSVANDGSANETTHSLMLPSKLKTEKLEENGLHENGENNNLEQSITQLLTNDATDASLNEMQDPDQKVVVTDAAAATTAVAQGKSAKRQLEPATTELPVNKKVRTTVVIDSDGEHEEVEECVVVGSEMKRQERAKVRCQENDTKLFAGGNNSKESGEVVIVGGRKEKSRRIQLEKSSSGFLQLLDPQGVEDDISDNDDFAPVLKKRRGMEANWQLDDRRNIECTACAMPLKKREVLRHPQFGVCMCKRCIKFLKSATFLKDKDGSESECRWCGHGGAVICCGACAKVICHRCIFRNFGAATLSAVVSSSDWHCLYCNPDPLKNLVQQFKQVEEEVGRLNILDDEDGLSDKELIIKQVSRINTKHRKNIRRALDDDELDEKTKNLLALEKERQERLEKWRAAARVNGGSTPVKPQRHSKCLPHANEELELCNDDIAAEGYVLNKARQEDEEIVRIAPSISGHLRSHQLDGLRFMWENCIESVNKVKSGADGLGCILAHSMGLGKTLQVIAFIHTVLNNVDLGLRTVLIVVPVNVLHNWRSEFNKWQPPNEKPITVYMLEDVSRDNMKRAMLLSRWQKYGGVMLIGYTAFRNLSMGKTVRDKLVREDLCTSLQHPGPDLLVCDEAHMIKNRKADITQALKQVRTRRRIALTGSPLQNNLMEYYCMVDFVREGFLGPAPSFKRRFQNPIENGQHADSTSKDVRLMKQRAHVLHKQVKGFVQRKNMTVLKDELPSKCVYVISVRLSNLQRKLYTQFLHSHGLLSNPLENNGRRSILFNAYHALAKIWNHPDLLLLAQEEKDLRKEDNLENFTVDTDEDIPNDVETCLDESPREVKSRTGNGWRMSSTVKATGELDDMDKSGWWKDIMEGQAREVVELSGKMVLLLKILSIASAKGDKVLVFSQSLHTLDLIETFLANLSHLHSSGGYWMPGRDWYRLDGQTSAKARQDLVEAFNDPTNTDVQCVLISTRAGSLGINLPAANRVIIVDGSWNPTHDLQALFRAWRFGQKKNVYAYRLLASGTMEEKIYNRQVSKEGLAARVLDEHQVGRFFVEDDLEFLFVLDEDEDGLVFDDTDTGTSQDLDKPSSSKPSTVVAVSGVSGGTQCASPTQEKGVAGQCTNPLQEKGAAAAASSGKLKRMAFSIPDDAPPRDDLMGRLLLEYRPRWVVRYHEHEPLLEDLEDEKLSKEEQAIAWESFQSEGTDRFVVPTLSAPIPSDDTTTTTSTTPKPQRCKPGSLW
ncbi:hypothetical protein CY35_17G044900 [Sphagnum magellanicum]|nr:hypothetical protein CY35_17G044900 [Sphagnum magellanicum]